jgi:molybdopterin synthase catalytic subunit
VYSSEAIMPEIKIQLYEGSLEDLPFATPDSRNYGAEVCFNGIIRGIEGTSRIEGIAYEAYSEMAEKVIRQILLSIADEHDYIGAEVIHRVGDVPVGESAIRVTVWSKHRKEAFNVAMEFMDRLKQDVPIWKKNTF